jgi:hypothetical protein
MRDQELTSRQNKSDAPHPADASRSGRARRAAAAVALVVALGIAATAQASGTSTSKDGPLTATFSAATHSPNCKQKWPVTVTARLHGAYTHAVAIYQFLFQGQVESTQYPFSSTSRNRADKPYHFYGKFTDTSFGPFGALSVGVPLTIRAVVTVGRYTAYPSYTVKVVKVSGCPPK